VGGHDVELVLDAEVGQGLEAGVQERDVRPGAGEDGYARQCPESYSTSPLREKGRSVIVDGDDITVEILSRALYSTRAS